VDTLRSFEQLAAELNENAFLEITSQAGVIFLVEGGVGHGVFDVPDSLFDLLFGVIEVGDDNFADVLPVVVLIDVDIPFLSPARWVLIKFMS